MIEFLAWKENEEETTTTCYVKTQQTYHPKLESMYYVPTVALLPMPIPIFFNYYSNQRTTALYMLSKWKI